jgi:preprotein translocase subunit YajC
MNAAPLIFFVGMAAVLWFVLIRPQRQRQIAHRSMVSDLGPGDEVITAGGVFGKVRSIADDHIVLEIAAGTEIRLAKEAVATVVPQESNPPAAAEGGG